MEQRGTGYCSEKKKTKQANKIQLQAALPCQLPSESRPAAPGGTKGKVAFRQQLVPRLPPPCPDALQDSSPILWALVLGDTQLPSYQETGKHPVFPWEAEDGRHRERTGIQFSKNLARWHGKDFPAKHWLTLTTPEWSLMFTCKSITNFGRQERI